MQINNTHKIDQKLQDEINRTERKFKEAEQKSHDLFWKLRRLRQQNRLSMTDHAKVRFLERSNHVHVDQVEHHVITEQLQAFYLELGDGTYPFSSDSGLRAVIKEGVIVTIMK